MPKTRTFSVFLVRSCATSWDEAGRLVGASDLPLCPQGRARFETELHSASEWELDAILAAPDESTVSVADMLGEATGGKVRQIPDLRDVELGLWNGLREQEVSDRYPTAYKQWINDPTSVQPPGAESLIDAESRILEALVRGLDKCKNGHTRIGVVVRPLAWAVIRCRIEGWPTARAWDALRTAPLVLRFEVDVGQLSPLVRAEP